MDVPGLLTTPTKRFSGLLALLCVLPALCEAEKLPATIYTTGQGLAHNTVRKVMPDSRGFIWFATREGLSRFDGYAFTNYGVDDGLPSAVINDLIETRDGVYLIATGGGLARLEMNARRAPGALAGTPGGALFSVHQVSSDPGSRYVLTLYEDSRGKVWIGTRAGLFSLETADGKMKFRRVDVGFRQSDPPSHLFSIREDRFGTLWVGKPGEARRLWPDGRIDTHVTGSDVLSILEDRAGHLWLGTQLRGVLELTFDEPSGRVATKTVYNSRNGLPRVWINTLFEPRDGELWAGTSGGLIQIVRTAAGPPGLRVLSEAHGLGRSEVQSIAPDRNANVWLGTQRVGAVKIARSGFTSFGAEDGFTDGTGLMQTRSGDLCFASGIGARNWGLYCFNGTSFDPIAPRLGAGSMYPDAPAQSASNTSSWSS